MLGLLKVSFSVFMKMAFDDLSRLSVEIGGNVSKKSSRTKNIQEKQMLVSGVRVDFVKLFLVRRFLLISTRH